MTNADEIRAKTDEELAEWCTGFVCGLCPVYYYCKKNRGDRACDEVLLEWLKKESEDDF